MDKKTFFDLRAADRLAYAVALAVMKNRISSRGDIAEALLDYCRIGQTDGPPNMPTWIEEHEKALVLRGRKPD